MSRICVKNIPLYLTEERLRDHFSAKGEVTDTKIIRTSDGYSRQFGFVGFRTDEEAQAALKHFDRSYLDTCRLTCELAYAIGDSQLSRPWSKYSEGSSAFKKTIQENDPEVQEQGPKKEKDGKVSSSKEKKTSEKPKAGKKNDGTEEDPMLQEFMEAMLPPSKRKLWANDTVEGIEGAPGVTTGQVNRPKKKKDVGKDGIELKKRKKKGGQEDDVPESGKKRKKVSEKAEIDLGSSDDESEELYENEILDEDDEDGVVELNSKKAGSNKDESLDEDADKDDEEGVVHDDAVSDMDYLKSRTKHDWNDDEDEDEDEENEEEEEVGGEIDDGGIQSEGINEASGGGEVEEEQGEERRGEDQYGDEEEAGPREVDADAQEGIAETGRLFVRNLCYTASDEDLRELFGRYGELSEVHLVVDKESRQSRGYAFVLFMLPENAVQAAKELDLSIFQGRLLHILPAKRPPPPPEDRGKEGQGMYEPGTSKFKQEREEQRKAKEAAGGTTAWSTLFMRPDTVAENLAQKYGIEKRELLDPEANDLAVRLALGETHIVAETKKSLEMEGVDIGVLEAFAGGDRKENNKIRSDKVILVKNLPFSTMEADIIGMFGRFGGLGRVVLPSTKTIALVEFLEASDAKKAFKGLAYKRFQHVPLYLEWAPKDILIEGKGRKVQAGQIVQKSENTVGDDKVKRINVAEDLTLEGETDSVEARSLFVKNLNFQTTEKNLRSHIKKLLETDTIRSVLIKKKKGPNGKELSSGFGFVEFRSLEEAKAARNQLQGSVLEGHALVFQLSHGRQTASPSPATGGKKTKKAEESSTKIIVRNVAFEATKKDMQQLFNPFGQIKSLRLPKKFDGSHRGFAFIEFVTRQEAQNAFNALQSTHLYGRHLVLAKAKEGEGLEELRARTAAQYQEGSSGASGGRRKKLSEIVDDAEADFENLYRNG